MHISDVILDCAQQCARLSRECSDREIGIALFKISARLLSVVTEDAELLVDDTPAKSKSA